MADLAGITQICSETADAAAVTYAAPCCAPTVAVSALAAIEVVDARGAMIWHDALYKLLFVELQQR